MLPSVKPMENRALQTRNRVQFGAASSSGGSLTRGLAYMEKQPILELGFKNIAAFSLPRLALSRNWKEFMDILPLEAANTVITMLSAIVLLPMLRVPVSKLAGKSLEKSLGSEYAPKYLKQEFSELIKKLPNQAKHELPVKLARLGAAFGFLFPFASAFWAAPFFRNWLTMKRTNSANFESIIGFDGVDNKKPKRSTAEEMKYQGQMTLKVLATGFGLGMASLLGFSMMARQMTKQNAGKLLEPMRQHLQGKKFDGFFNAFDLKGATSNQIKGRVSQLLFWAAPAYLGWLHGARSGNEFRERAIQSANGVFWFFFAAKLMNPAWKKAFKGFVNESQWDKAFVQKLKNDKKQLQNEVHNFSYEDIRNHFRGGEKALAALRGRKNLKAVLNDYGIPIGSLSAVQFINFKLTENKIKEAQAGHPPTAATPQPQTQTPVAAMPTQAFVPSTPPIFYPAYSQPVTPGQNPYAWPGLTAQS
jgi:hypothetical protein